MRIRVEVCHVKDRQVFNSGESRRSLAPITSAIGVPSVLGCDFSSLGIPFYVLVAGQPNFIAMVMDGRNTAPIPMAAKIMRWVIRANESTTYRRCEERNLKRQGNVANRALEVLGKELRMFIDRKEFGRPGDFSGMSEDELDKRIRELAASEEAGIGAASGREETALRQSPAEASVRLATYFGFRVIPIDSYDCASILRVRCGSQPVKLETSICCPFDIRQQTFAADSRPSGTDEAAGAPSCPNR